MEQSESILELTNRIYKSMEMGDYDSMRDMWSTQEGTLAIGTDPREWWKGAEKINNVFAKQIEELKGIKLVESDPETYEENNIGWLADNVTWEIGGNQIPVRITAVFRKEQNDWKAVQWHASMGITNEEAIGEELSLD